MKIEPGLHRIGDDVIAAYLLVDDGGVTVIDAGLPGLRRALRRELAAIGRSEEDIRGVILTHADADHIGFAEALRSEQGVPVFVGVGEEAYARGTAPAQPNEKSAWKLGPAVRFLLAGLRWGGRSRRLVDVVTAADGDVLDLPGSPRVIALPGHTAGHIAVHAPAHGALFVGDALTTRHVLTGLGPTDAPFSEQPAQARASLERLRGVATRYVLPGHGPVWRGTADALIDAIAATR